MVNICFRKFKETLPEVGRTVIVWGDKYGGFDEFYIGQKSGVVTIREFENYEEEWYEALCVGEDEIGNKDYGIDVEDYWTYEDEVFPVLFDGYFYQDWKWYAKKGYAKMKVCRIDDIYIDKYERKNRYIDYIWEMNGHKWLMKFNYNTLFTAEKM